ncbi:MAG: DUF2202 domain-containing protein [Pseudomonadales bacterium]|nr:DUF2202 domain-containing protein [Pseudomonadales bacterium]
MQTNSLISSLALALLLVTGYATGQALTPDERNDLLLMREEEKLARDVYLALDETWHATVFSSITESEQRHMDAVLNLLNFFGIPDPAAGNAAGVFSNSELQELYHLAVDYGGQSLVAALEVGVYIEQTDIEDLQNAIARTSWNNIARVYSNLLRGSTNHLAAFTNNLDAVSGNQNGGAALPGTAVYEPISQTLYVPAIDITLPDDSVVVLDALLRLVETFPQALELVNASETSKLPSVDHASFSFDTGTLTLPDLVVGANHLDPIDDTHYTATLQLLEADGVGVAFVVTSLVAK